MYAAVAMEVRREKAIRDGLQGGEPVISMKEVLQQIKMTRYYTYFRDAQVETVEHFNRKTDQEVNFRSSREVMIHESTGV